MSVINDLTINHWELTLYDVLSEIDNNVPAQLGADSLATALRVEQMHVAASFVCEFFGGRAPKQISIFEIVGLDCRVVAARVACDGGAQAIAGIARCVRGLIEHARTYLGGIESAAQGIPASLTI
jgi:hypothetical protein